MDTILDKFDLSGKVGVVTGGAGLLGKEFCRTLAEAGASVVVADINSSKLRVVAEELERSGYNALGLELDVSNLESIKNGMEVTLKTFGRLDILVNSAALDPKF